MIDMTSNYGQTHSDYSYFSFSDPKAIKVLIMKRYIAVIGLQNGDEGKGKIVAYLVSQMFNHMPLNEKLLVYRYQGGPNAGHTVKIGDQEYALHQLPSGLVIPDVYGLLGTGMLINPTKAVEEINGLNSRGITIDRRKLVSLPRPI